MNINLKKRFIFWKLNKLVLTYFRSIYEPAILSADWNVKRHLIGCILSSRPIIGFNTKICLKIDAHSRDPLISFDLQVNLFMNHLCLNINQIGRAWCQTIGNWGQETQISHYFKETLSEKPEVFFIKIGITSGNSWQLPVGLLLAGI